PNPTPQGKCARQVLCRDNSHRGKTPGWDSLLMVRYCRLTLEILEDRTVPATFGIPWPNAGHLTLSFAPDGTQVGNQPSQLFRLLNAVAPTATWQTAILRAFQSWAAPTNINLSVVPDSGDPLGTVGPLQGDSRFGDIRITAVPLPPDVLG